MIMLLSGITVHAYFKLDKNEKSHRLFFRLLILILIVLLLEILSVVVNSNDYIHSIRVHRLVDTLGFVLSLLVPISAVLYVQKRIDPYSKIKKLWWLGLGIPFMISSILSLGSYQYDWIFYISDENSYARGPLFFVAPMAIYFYYVVNLLILYNKRKGISREEFLMLSLFTTIPGVMAVFQLQYFIYLTIWNSTAMAVIINYIYIVHSQIKIDSLTGLGNRVAYNEYLANQCKRRDIPLSVVNIDLDDFKIINDVCGHEEGDHVLILFARQLEYVFRGKGISIRMGGDEFIVLLTEKHEEIIEEYMKRLIDNIVMYNETSKMPYTIKFSYGIAIFNNQYNTIHELIRHSDQLMYAKKQKRASENQ